MTMHFNDTLRKELKSLIRNAEDLVESTREDLNDSAKEARKRLNRAIESAKMSCGDLEKKAMESAKATDETIRSHPYETAGICFAAGLLIGVLFSRR
jgi:ElaB/YqjD/DUF883 family membrane-anchored ribosome-binding protein